MEPPHCCASWSVKDIAAHLLDTSVRRLSLQRDRFRPRVDQPTDTYPELVAYLNPLNADWVAAFRRVSPALLIELLELTGPPVAELFGSLDPYARALFPVAWAGQAESANWFDVGWKYTEPWLLDHPARGLWLDPLCRPAPIAGSRRRNESGHGVAAVFQGSHGFGDTKPSHCPMA